MFAEDLLHGVVDIAGLLPPPPTHTYIDTTYTVSHTHIHRQLHSYDDDDNYSNNDDVIQLKLMTTMHGYEVFSSP